ncbi:hypothetical protein KO561_07000 [Radiobacillus kanasensis]|uniref:hypothetical protein n=1 Tax=Radiobacillus kanasensis TaxID=2844358 RepID=UPI001E523555|nr:hypothetical protein [Radiobacillus kanasensis]UFU00676.1 hypothetical protein KO561_07000 [Radiobacillus kanasensis]
MKSHEETEFLDSDFKSIGTKVNLSIREQQMLWYNINSRMNEEMNVSNRKSQKWKYFLSFAGAILVVVLLALPLFQLIEEENVDGDSEILKEILNKQFSGPDQELMNLLEDPDNLTIIGKEESKPKGPTELDKYLEEEYKSSFTDDAYQTFIGSYLLDFQSTAHYGDYKLQAESIDLEQSDSNDEEYMFKVKVGYQKGEIEKGYAEVTGRAKVNAKGEVYYYKLEDDGGLSQALRSGM